MRRAYYGWWIVGTLAITETISWGILYYAFSVFITPMEAELGWTRAELTAGFSLSLLVMGLLAFPVGAWIDKHGARELMTAGSIGGVLLVLAWSQVSDRTLFYLIWAGLGMCAAAVLYEPAFTVIANWFVKKRARALATITFAAGFASTIFLPLSNALLNGFGWRTAVMLLGIGLAVTIPMHALLLRRRPADLGLLPDGEPITPDGPSAPVLGGITVSAALRSPIFWLLAVAFSVAVLSAESVRVHFIPFLIDLGIDPGTAALASGSIGIMQVAGRLIFAPIERRLTTRGMVTGVLVMQAASLMVLLIGTGAWLIGMFIVTFGMSYGAKTLARASVIAELFGSMHYGRISSVLSIFGTIAGTAAPYMAAVIYDTYGTYTPVLWVAVALALVAAGVMVAGALIATRRITQTAATAPRSPA